MMPARLLSNVFVAVVISISCTAIATADNQNNQNGQQGQNGPNNNQQNGQQGQNGPNNNGQNGNNDGQNGQHGNNPNGPQWSKQDQIRFLDQEIDDLEDVREGLQGKLVEARKRIANSADTANVAEDNLQDADNQAGERKQEAQAKQEQADQAAGKARALRQKLRGNVDEHDDVRQSAEHLKTEESKLNDIAKPLLANLEKPKTFERAQDRLRMVEFRLERTQEQRKNGLASPRALVDAMNDVNRLKHTVSEMKENEFIKNEAYREQKEVVEETRADHLRLRHKRASDVAANPKLKAAYKALAEKRKQELETRKGVVGAFKAKCEAESVAKEMKTRVAALSGNVQQIERVSRELDELIANRKARRLQLAGVKP